jgi:hypothetical protein
MSRDNDRKERIQDKPRDCSMDGPAK